MQASDGPSDPSILPMKRTSRMAGLPQQPFLPSDGRCKAALKLYLALYDAVQARGKRGNTEKPVKA